MNTVYAPRPESRAWQETLDCGFRGMLGIWIYGLLRLQSSISRAVTSLKHKNESFFPTPDARGDGSWRERTNCQTEWFPQTIVLCPGNRVLVCTLRSSDITVFKRFPVVAMCRGSERSGEPGRPFSLSYTPVQAVMNADYLEPLTLISSGSKRNFI